MELDLEMDEFMDLCKENAMTELRGEGSVMGIVFFRPNEEPNLPVEVNPDGKPTMGCIPMSLANNKEEWYRMIGFAVKRLKAKFTVMVVESWVSTQPDKDGDEYIRPSLDPNAKDAICVNGVEYDAAGLIVRNKMITLPFAKENEEYVFFEEDYMVVDSDIDGFALQSTLADVTARDDLA